MLFQKVRSAFESPFCITNYRANRVRIGKIRLEFNSLAAVYECFVKALELQQRSSAIAVGFSIIGLESDGFVVTRYRLLQLVQSPQRDAAIVVGLKVIRFDGNGFVVTGNRRGQLLEFLQRIAAILVGFSI